MSNKTTKILKILGIMFFIAGIVMLIVGITVSFSNDPFEFEDDFTPLIIIGGISIFVGFVMIAALITISAFNKFKDLSKSVLSDEVDPNSDSFIDLVKSTIKKQKDAEIKAHTCDYCGGSLKDDETKCPNCGAPKKR